MEYTLHLSDEPGEDFHGGIIAPLVENSITPAAT